MEVYITKANVERIINKMDVSEIQIEEFKNEIRFKWFNSLELKRLKAHELFYSNIEEFSSMFKVMQPYSNSNYVYPTKAPAFHSTASCERLTADFENLKIPEGIKTANRTEEFRGWCLENKELFEKYPDQFNYLLEKKFKIENRDIFVYFQNSGVEVFENYSASHLENAIENKIDEALSFILSSEIHKKVIKAYGYLSFNYKFPDRIDMDKIKVFMEKKKVIQILETFELSFKQPIMKMMKNYYRLQNNEDLKFDSDILTGLGFNCCFGCHKVTMADLYAA